MLVTSFESQYSKHMMQGQIPRQPDMFFWLREHIMEYVENGAIYTQGSAVGMKNGRLCFRLIIVQEGVLSK